MCWFPNLPFRFRISFQSPEARRPHWAARSCGSQLLPKCRALSHSPALSLLRPHTCLWFFFPYPVSNSLNPCTYMCTHIYISTLWWIRYIFIYKINIYTHIHVCICMSRNVCILAHAVSAHSCTLHPDSSQFILRVLSSFPFVAQYLLLFFSTLPPLGRFCFGKSCLHESRGIYFP